MAALRFVEPPERVRIPLATKLNPRLFLGFLVIYPYLGLDKFGRYDINITLVVKMIIRIYAASIDPDVKTAAETLRNLLKENGFREIRIQIVPVAIEYGGTGKGKLFEISPHPIVDDEDKEIIKLAIIESFAPFDKANPIILWK